MSLRLICGRAGTGKSEFCFQNIKKNITQNNKIYIITPEQYSFTAEKRLLEIVEEKSSVQAEVLTFARMAYRVSSEVGGLTKLTLSQAGKAMLIYDILEKQKKNLTFLGKSTQNVELISTQLTELKKHNVSLQDLKNNLEQIQSRYLQEKLKDIITIYEKYEEKLEGKYIEENDRLHILANQLEHTSLFENAIFYIDEFNGFTKQEYNIIEILLKQAAQINITVTTDNLDMGTTRETDLFYRNKQTADKLLYLARSNEIPCEKTVFLKKCYRFQAEELSHLEENIQVMPYQVYAEEVKNISLFLAKNPYSEVEQVAKQITKLVKQEKYRYRDIVVMTKGLQPYASLCKAIFHSYQIPIFMDEKKELSQNEFVKFMLALLEVYATNWSHEAVIQYSKTEFVELEEERYEFENNTKKWGIKGAKWYQKEWKFGEETQENKEQWDRMNAIRNKVILPLWELKQTLVGRKTIEDINQAMYEFLVAQKIKEKIEQKQKRLEEEGKIELAKEQELAWNIVMQVLDEMNVLFGKDKITFTIYRELLKVGLGQNGLGKIPQTQDQVIIGDLDRTKIHQVKAIFLLGVNDGVFPTIQKQEGFFNDADREELKEKGMELAKGTLENLYEDKVIIYQALSSAEEKIFFSYASSNAEGVALRPSTYITKLKKIFPALKEKSDVMELPFEMINKQNTFEELLNQLRKRQEGEEILSFWDTVYAYYEQEETWKDTLKEAEKAMNVHYAPEEMNRQNIQKLYGNTLITSVSKLEQYQNCPFSYYLKYALKLKSKEEFKMQSIDTGSFMHEVMDEFFHLIRERELEIKELEEEQIISILEEIIEEKLAFAKYYIFSSTEKFKILTNKLKKLIFQSMKYLLEGLKNSDFNVYASELEFKRGKEYNPIVLELKEGKKVEITGKIDRVDLGKTEEGKYLRIIDYKSSVRSIDLNEVVAGVQIQLLTYLDAMCKIEEVMPAGILYYSLIDPIIKAEKPMSKEQMEEEMKKKFKMNGLILADVKVVKMMDKTLEKGASHVIPAYLDKDGNLSNRKIK